MKADTSEPFDTTPDHTRQYYTYKFIKNLRLLFAKSVTTNKGLNIPEIIKQLKVICSK